MLFIQVNIFNNILYIRDGLFHILKTGGGRKWKSIKKRRRNGSGRFKKDGSGRKIFFYS